MNAQHLARQLADAATRTATARAQRFRDGGPIPPTAETAEVLSVPVDSDEVPTGWWVYGRAIWPLGDDITDDRVLVEGTDRRSYAALNHYLREGRDPAADRARGLARRLPVITESRVGFERSGDTVRVTPAAAVAVLVADR